MHWCSAISTSKDLTEAVIDVASHLVPSLQNRQIDLLLVFVSRHHAAEYRDLPRLLRRHLPHRHLLGCSAGGVIGGGREIEAGHGLSITAAHLPEVAMAPVAMQGASLPDDDASPRAWSLALGVPLEPTSHFLLLADPFSCQASRLLAGLDYAYPGSVKIGGLASGASQPGGNILFLDDVTHRTGLVGLALQGNITVDTIVAQGCRPIGEPLRITRGRGHVLRELEGRPALEILRDMISQLPARDRELAGQALFVGVEMNELAAAPGRREYLIRNIVGVDTDSGALVVGEELQGGQMLQFHVRDAESSAEDLDLLLRRYVTRDTAKYARGALLFSCLGRGRDLYGFGGHDTESFQGHLKDVPVGGFFCNGEIGPVGGATHLHGYTSSFGIFSPARPRA